MIAVLSDSLEAFVQSEVKQGRFASRDEVIATALREMQVRQSESEEFSDLRQALRAADEDVAAGRVRQFENETELRAFADEIKSRGRERLGVGQAAP